jgi:ABC-type amino acid transport substrate-binding protein
MSVPSQNKLNLYVAANPSTSPALIDRLRKALEAIRRSGELDRIRQQFFVRFNAGSASAPQ